jgi:dihydroorotate dehydrogenase
MSPTSLRALCSLRRPLLRPMRPAYPRNAFQRHASTSPAAGANSVVTRMKNLLYGTSLTLFAVLTYLYITDTRASVHQWLVVPAIRYIYPDAEDAHHAGTKMLRTLYSFGIHPRERNSKSEDTKSADLSVTVLGHKLQNPIGTSAGIDKLGEIPDALMALGPAIVEVGGVTPLPQEGNPKPRVFRIPSQNALINRYGLNGLGADDMARRLRERVRLFAYSRGYGLGEEAEELVLNGGAGVNPGSLTDGKLLLVQVAKNKDTKDEDIEAVKRDYVYCVERVAPYADVLVVNVSSPNTPGLRTLQRVEPLTKILDGVVTAAKSTKRNTPPKVMVKVSPDEDEGAQIEGIVEAIWRSGVDGVIVGNTTKRRHGFVPEGSKLSVREREILDEQGGLSGPHMFERTLGLVKRYRKLLDEGPPPSIQDPSKALGANHEPKVIFATGGITNGKQALEVLNAGASVAQIYTALIYGGVGTVSRIKREMKNEILRKK